MKSPIDTYNDAIEDIRSRCDALKQAMKARHEREFNQLVEAEQEELLEARRRLDEDRAMVERAKAALADPVLAQEARKRYLDAFPAEQQGTQAVAWDQLTRGDATFKTRVMIEVLLVKDKAA